METKILFLQIGIILLSIAVCLLAIAVKSISKTLHDRELMSKADDLFGSQSRINQKFG